MKKWIEKWNFDDALLYVGYVWLALSMICLTFAATVGIGWSGTFLGVATSFVILSLIYTKS